MAKNGEKKNVKKMAKKMHKENIPKSLKKLHKILYFVIKSAKPFLQKYIF